MTTTKSILHTVNGAVGTRKSPRTYVAAVIGHWDFDRALKNAPRDAEQSIDQNWRYNVACAMATAGECYSKYEPTYSFPVTQDMIDSANAFFAKYSNNFQTAVARKQAELIVALEEKRARMGSKPQVLQWSMSERAARNAMETFRKYGWCQIAVAPVVRHAK